MRLSARWPAGDLPIAVRVLGGAEAAEARAGDELAETLARAIVDPLSGRPLFESADELKAVASPDECRALWRLYQEHRASVDPDVRHLTEEEFARLDEGLRTFARDPLEVYRAVHAVELVALFGRPACELTDTQVLLHHRLTQQGRGTAPPPGPARAGHKSTRTSTVRYRVARRGEPGFEELPGEHERVTGKPARHGPSRVDEDRDE